MWTTDPSLRSGSLANLWVQDPYKLFTIFYKFSANREVQYTHTKVNRTIKDTD